jgi:Ser/Thr protein kinase RdoA (MazF antagonist)
MNDLVGILEQFGVHDASFKSLGDTENTNFLVTATTGERYVLRQHRSESHSIAALESEMLWLNYLHSHGLEAQRPISLPAGNFIVVNELGRFSLLSWIEGEVLENINAAQAEAVGVLMARLHIAARDFTPPPSIRCSLSRGRDG